MPPDPVVSILMPVYNAERFVAEAVESIIAQTFADFEVLITDDGSTDGSREILERFATKDARIRLKSRPNAGLVNTLNEMLTEARGKYLARMDADDISHPHRLQRQCDFLNLHSDHVLVGSAAALIDEDGDRICERFEFQTHEEIDGWHIERTGASMCHPAIMGRKSLFVDLGGYNDEFKAAEDHDFFLRAAEAGRVANLPEVLFFYRMHSNSVSRAQQKLQRERSFASIQAARQRRGLPPLAAAANERPRTLNSESLQRAIAWWALAAGNIATARKHARQLVVRHPLAVENWRALACAIRGH